MVGNGKLRLPLIAIFATALTAMPLLRPLAEPLQECGSVDRDDSRNLIPEDLQGLAATARTIKAEGVTVEWAVFPLPYPDGKTWSIWGKGTLASNGRFYAAVGDHDSPGPTAGPRDGNSYLYEYDPATRVLRAVGDAQSAHGHKAGETGYGKIHGRIDEGPCGLLYLHTYWGSQQAVVYTEKHRGDVLLRYNPWTKHLESLGVLMPRTGTPSTNLWLEGGLFYGEAGDPFSMGTVFWVYDLKKNEVIFEGQSLNRHNRNIAIDLEGRAYYTGGGPALYRYDPVTNTETKLAAVFPGGGWLRASTRAAADGTITMVTREPDAFFDFDPRTGSLRKLADAESYVADIETARGERTAYYVPGAHGDAARLGFPLRQIDRKTGERGTIALLAPAVAAASGITPAGAYSITAAPNGRDIYIAANAGPQNGFGSPLLLVVHLPE